MSNFKKYKGEKYYVNGYYIRGSKVIKPSILGAIFKNVSNKQFK